GSTLFMTMLSVFNVLLYRYSGQADFCVGTPIANRTHKELESVVGFFVNTLVLRNRIDGDPSFSQYLQQAKSETLSAFAHQDVPFEQIVERVEPARDLSRSPVFQVMFGVRNTPETPSIRIDGMSITSESFEQLNVKFDLNFTAVETGDGLVLKIE